MSGYVFLPAIVLMGVYGLMWFVIGLEAGQDYGDGFWTLALWVAGNLVFGYPIYLALVEVYG